MSYLPIIFLIITYFIAAIPFGLLISRVFAKKDIRKHGSNNIGATNVSRVLGKKLGLLTLILDGSKGAITVVLARYYFHDITDLHLMLVLVATVAVLGHIYPIYLKFRGGKGVATAIATILALDPVIGITISAIWIVAFLLFRVSAVASLVSIFSSSILSFYYHATDSQTIFCLLIFIVIFCRHKENILRLISGEEKKI